MGPSTQTPTAADSRPASSTLLFRLLTASVGFFALRQPTICPPLTNSNILGLSSVENVNQADAESPQGVRFISEQGALTIYCVFVIPDHTALIEPQPSAPTLTVPEYDQLQRDLAYINDHDEFSDVVSENVVVEDSLSSEILEPTSKPTTDAQEESQASEAREHSSIHRHLRVGQF